MGQVNSVNDDASAVLCKHLVDKKSRLHGPGWLAGICVEGDNRARNRSRCAGGTGYKSKSTIVENHGSGPAIIGVQPGSCYRDQTKVTLSAGRNVDPTHCHNVGQLFNLAASTQAASLTATGSNTVVTERISSVQDFNNGLTTNGTISGGVSYFGHGAQMPQADGSYLSVLAPGQGAGVDTNVSALNVSTLSNSQLGQNVRITLNACNAGLPPIRGGGHSIAQLIANQLNRPVLAWKVGTFFANDLTTRFPKKLNPQSNLIYMVPTGGSDIAPCTFTPNQPEPQHCGGVK